MKEKTEIVTAGRNAALSHGAINMPAYRASTISHPNLASWREAGSKRLNKDTYVYGRFGTPTARAFEEAVAAVEGADRAVSVSSGMAACAAAILSAVKAGDHMLVIDCVYAPVRSFCENFLKKMGVETEYFRPDVGADIGALVRDNTALIYLEAPGTHSFEVCDVPAITAVAKEKGIRTALDNTWASPYFFKPLAHGVDLSINAATKYIVGHSDAMLGVISMREDLHDDVKMAAMFTGNCAGSEELYLGLRGLRTLSVRMPQHHKSALTVAQWFQDQNSVHRVLYPALPDFPDHALWKRDFTGAAGLFTVMFNAFSDQGLAALIDGLKLFHLGASFGGYESLVLPTDLSALRTATRWSAPGPCVRFHIGLEDVDDLIADLDAGLKRLEQNG